jgi:capsular polysaccharide export protein
VVSDGSSRDRRETPEQAAFCFAFGPWKFGFVRAYLAACGLRPRFCRYAWQARLRGFDRHSRAIVWGLRERPDLVELAADHAVSLWRMEDGFLRSVGLGSDFNVPASLVLDRTGIYFDPTRPSDLESLLQAAEFAPAELARAAALRKTVVDAALSKYNFAFDRRLDRPVGKRVLLVPGQVEDDASIRLGCVDIRTNEALLAEVRRRHPDAHVIFKPHPDLLSGNRKQGVLGGARLRELCDQVITDAPLPACLAIADEVHTMTSLAGFEALLRNLQVTTHGQPFYSGWGLTTDLAPLARRTRRRTLDELVAAALILYPRYVDPISRLPCGPEVVLRRLAAEAAAIQAGEGAIRSRLKHGAALVRHRILGGLLRLLP